MRYDLERRIRLLEDKARVLGNGFEVSIVCMLEDGTYLSINRKQPVLFSSRQEVEECYRDTNGSVIIDEWLDEDYSELIKIAKKYK